MLVWEAAYLRLTHTTFDECLPADEACVFEECVGELDLDRGAPGLMTVLSIVGMMAWDVVEVQPTAPAPVAATSGARAAVFSAAAAAAVQSARVGVVAAATSHPAAAALPLSSIRWPGGLAPARGGAPGLATAGGGRLASVVARAVRRASDPGSASNCWVRASPLCSACTEWCMHAASSMNTVIYNNEYCYIYVCSMNTADDPGGSNHWARASPLFRRPCACSFGCLVPRHAPAARFCMPGRACEAEGD